MNIILSRLKKHTFNSHIQYSSNKSNVTRDRGLQGHKERQTSKLIKSFGIFVLSLTLVACGTFNRYDDVRSSRPTDPHSRSNKTTPPASRSTHKSAAIPAEKLYICEDITQYINHHVGSGECVDLLKACAKTPHTQQWRPGDKVWGNNIPTGTAIATFKRAKYPNKHGYHAAIYVSQDEKGIYVWDQWREKAVHLRLIRFDQRKKKPGNDATRYRVITQ